jgi:hypothetical protein
MIKYVSPTTEHLTPEDWETQINLSSMTLDEMVDLLGDLKAMEAFGKKVGGYIKTAIITRMPEDEDEYATDNFFVMRNYRVRAGGLDKDLITEEMGEDWIEEHSKEPTEYAELRLKRVASDG